MIETTKGVRSRGRPTLAPDGCLRPEGAPPVQRALGGWSPPDLPADSWLARSVDRTVPRHGMGFVLYWAVAFALEYGVAPRLPVRGGVAVEALAALAAGLWCGVNFWRCRHAHCLASGPGWLVLGLLGVAGALVGHSVIGGYDQVVFFGVLVVALVFEAAWRWARGANALWRPPTPPL